MGVTIDAQSSLVAWRASEATRGLTDCLRELRVAVSSPHGIVLYRPRGSSLRVLLSDTESDSSAFISDEPVRCNISWDSRSRMVCGVSISSTMRPVSAAFHEALVVPFANGQGRGAVILAAATTVEIQPDIVADLARDIDLLREREHQIRHGDVDRAYRLVARAASADLSLERIFDVTLAAARYLMGSQIAYLSTPVDDDRFFFSRTLGVNTADFRNLRVGYGEGLGGAARALGKPVRSLNYDDDDNLRDAKLKETRGEGIYSALATPVSDHGDVEAVMYVASREPRAYSERDERVLADFSSAALLGLDRALLEEQRSASIRDQERERLARKLHDDLVRRLTQISMSAAQLSEGDDPNGPVATISSSVEECMWLIRDELRLLASGSETTLWTVERVADSILEVPAMTTMTRRLAYVGLPRFSGTMTPVPSEVAEALVSIGQEALFNAEHHARGTMCRIEIEYDEGTWRLSVADDGTAPSSQAQNGHFGVEFMRSQARKLGGTIEFRVNELGGLTVGVGLPGGQ